MPPSDGMENTSKKSEALKMPVDKRSVDKKSVGKTSVDSLSMSFGEMSMSTCEMSMSTCEMSTSTCEMSTSSAEMSLAFDKPSVNKTSVDKTSVDKTSVDKKSSGEMPPPPPFAKIQPALSNLSIDKMPIGAKRRSIEPATKTSKPETCFRFMDLPYNIRKQIRHESLLMDEDRGKPFLTTGLARVSKEWRDDIEEVLFNDITINPLDHDEVEAFKEKFSTDTRRKLLNRITIALDDSKTGPWHAKKGIFQIGRIVASVGHFLGYVNGWDLGKSGRSQKPLEIVFATSRFPDARIDWSHGRRPIVNTTSLWQKSHLRRATGKCFKLAKKLFLAKNLKFPSSLDMVTHLSIPPDCFPFDTADSVIQAMPNLKTLVLDPKFDVESSHGWNHLNRRFPHLESTKAHRWKAHMYPNLGIIMRLDRWAPSLQSLEVRNTAYVPDHGLRPLPAFPLNCMGNFSFSLMYYSQELQSLRAIPFKLDDTFIRPFTPRPRRHQINSEAYEWPRLQNLDLQFFEHVPYRLHSEEAMAPEPYKDWEGCELRRDVGIHGQEILYVQTSGGQRQYMCLDWDDEDEYEDDEEEFDEGAHHLAASDILIAAGMAATFMPVLESARISVWSLESEDPIIFVKRKLCPESGTTTSSRVWLSGCFDSEDRSKIMDAWAEFLGPDHKVDEALQSEFPEVPRAIQPTR